MTIDAANNWPLALVPLPREKVLQAELATPISVQNHQNPATLNNVSEIESNELWEKGTFVDLYV